MADETTAPPGDDAPPGGSDAAASDLDATGRAPGSPGLDSPDPAAVDRAGGAAGGPTFPVVGIGASAGGLAAFQAFFEALPARPGMAFVLVQHLSPDHESALAEIVQQRTQMAVRQVDDHPVVEADCVYVIPPGKHLEIEDGRLRLVELRRDRGRPTAVDHFFRTLAQDVGERAVAVVLSGTGSDGALGLKAIKERAGLTLVQDPDDAGYDGMPNAAIATGLVDVTGTPAELADRLVGIRDAVDDGVAPVLGPVRRGDEEALRTIFAHLRRRTGHDFTHYKRSTIRRRLARRLQVTGLETLPAYADHVRTDADETRALLRDFLISVTQFFRDPDAFEALDERVLPALFAGGPEAVRAWVPGCATGEEAYSVAMLLHEHAARLPSRPAVQVFATDIDEDAVAHARAGVYPESALADVAPDRRARFFEEAGSGHRVKQELRESVLFAVHNLISDPPFSRLDLVACRNVLIYFNREIQARAFRAFHYGLRPGGVLFLGSSEAPGSVTSAFEPLEERARIYRRRDVAVPGVGFPVPPASDRGGAVGPRPPRPAGQGGGAGRGGGVLDRYAAWTLSRYGPPRLLVDERFDLTHVLGRAGDYLRDREGPVTQNAVDRVERAFQVDLRAALHRAFADGEPTDTPFRRVAVGGGERAVRLHVGPVGGAAASDGLVEVVFVELDAASLAALDARAPDDAPPPDPDGLEDEVRRLRDELRATVEDRETSTEELRASNEELQSLNEELQSATEELETSREELQSMNEELHTVNDELKDKVGELTALNGDLQNLIASTDVGTLFLDRDLRLKRFTPRAAELFHVIPSDVGRPVGHLAHGARDADFEAVAREVQGTLVPVTRTVHAKGGRAHLLRAVPYRTADDRIDGVVLSFVDVTDLEEAQAAAAARAEQQAAVADLGALALGGAALGDLFDRAVARVRAVLGADAAKVLRLEPGGLRLVAGVGWDDGLVGAAVVPDDVGSQAGYTLRSPDAVLVEDLAAEPRFVAPDLLTDHGVRSGVSVVVGGGADGPFGVLGVHWRGPRAFSDDDGRFVQSVANVLGAAVERDRQATTIREQLGEIEAVYDTAPVGLAFIDRELRHRRINRRLAEINGRPVEEHLGRTVREIDPDLARFVEPIHRRVLETGEALVDYEVTGADPRDKTQTRTWLTSYVPQVNAEGGVDGINVVVRDVTERRRKDEVLAETARRLRVALEGGQLGTFSRDFETGTITFDRAARDLLGAPAEEPFDDALRRVVADDVDRVTGPMDRAADPASGPDTYASDVRVRLADGAVRWVALRGEVTFEGEGPDRRPARLDGVVLDVTALKEAEEAVRRQLGETDSYVNAIPAALGVFDASGRLVRANARAAAMAGRDPEDMAGLTPADLYPDGAGALKAALRRVLDTGEPVADLEVRAAAPADPGDERVWLASAYPVWDGEAVVGASVMLHDVTALTRARAELASLTEELEGRVRERTAQVRRLAADLTDAEQRERKRVAQVLHDDLQQLLYAVQFKIELARKAPDPAALDATEALVARAVQTTRSLTVDLSPPVLKGEGLEATLEWLALRMNEAYGIDVRVRAPGPVAVGSTVHVLLFQLVRELLFNVVKHAGTGEAEVRVARDGDDVRVEVVDRGAGFDPDARGERAGFGLFSVRERVQLVGGTVAVESGAGRGTTVTVVCPATL